MNKIRRIKFECQSTIVKFGVIKPYWRCVVGVILIVILIYLFLKYTDGELKQIEIAKECYEFKGEEKAIKLLDDIMTSPPKLDKTIFFHDTSCGDRSGIVSLTSRQACAVESAAKHNPNRDIFVLLTASVGFLSNGTIDSPIIKALSSYPNIKYRAVDWYNYAVNTPAEDWVKKDKMLATPHFKGHLSDFIRILSLYRFGGLHFDLDFVVQKNLDDLSPNFSGAHDENEVANAAYGFESRGTGHQIIEMILRNFTEHYSTIKWYINGPILMSNVLEKICGTRDWHHVKSEQCLGVKIYDQPAFYPINHCHLDEYTETDPKKLKKIQEKVKDSYAVHFSNYKTRKHKIFKSNATNIYRILAEKNCPKVWEATGDEF